MKSPPIKKHISQKKADISVYMRKKRRKKKKRQVQIYPLFLLHPHHQILLHPPLTVFPFKNKFQVLQSKNYQKKNFPPNFPSKV